jgi:transporter family protein
MKSLLITWPFWAALSAAFAALTAIFGKVGVEGINSDFATLIRTIVILAVLIAIVSVTGAWQPFASISRRTYTFLILSGLATGASWLCYYRALKLGPASGVAPIDKMSVLLVALFAVTFLGERLELRNWVGIGMIALGTVLVALRS